MQFDKVEIKDLFNKLNEKLQKTVDAYTKYLSELRVGRANTAILNKVNVSYYGQETPLNQVANIAVPEARMITITPWEKNMLSPIEKAIQEANIGINPNNDGKTIRLIFPELNEERRKSIAKELKAQLEQSKVALRNARRDAMDSLKNYKKNSIISEDEENGFSKDVDKLLSIKIDEIDNLAKAKEKEVMSI